MIKKVIMIVTLIAAIYISINVTNGGLYEQQNKILKKINPQNDSLEGKIKTKVGK